jgi:DNA-binding HxlR family transcriptional regulator
LDRTNKSVRASPDGCAAIAETLSRIGDKWTVLVIANLSAGGAMRYSELRRSIAGISQRMLTLTLRGLKRDGLVTRTVYPTIPPRVDYELTVLGRKLVEPLRILYDWAVEHRPEMLTARKAFEARRTE